jgi:hypothetical protein
LRSIHGAVLIVSLSLLVGCSSGDRYGPVVLEGDLACRIEIDSSEVLDDVSDVLGDDLGIVYDVNSRGDIVGGAYGSPKVGVWDSTGRYLMSVGSAGDGPGELGQGMVLVFIAADDTVFIRDSHMHWAVFDPYYGFVRNANSGPVVGIEASHTSFLADGSIATTMHTSRDTSFTMLIADRYGDVLAQIGPPHSLPGLNHRPMTPDGAGGFWVGPPPGPAWGYFIEHWSGAGVADGGIRRDVPWFRLDPSYVELNARQPRSPRIRRGFPFPSIDQIRYGQGKLWVLSTVPTAPDVGARYMVVSDDSADAIGRSELVRVLEVFDASSGQVIASVTMPTYRFSFFHNAVSSGYRVEEDGDGHKVTVMKFGLRAAGADHGKSCNVGSSPPEGGE